ncbi:hypothetical protein UFOVP5_37 [uncultured Caudovirales phage]|uniref:Uncharacterized protein n=1 Tax=uncultured Caudovirales phage TaxID=2100421 RepID=A0A6J5KK78_9CAUD|nr:hypothetical protein UFOVP5_37 [uncultured Caudovirales phage]
MNAPFTPPAKRWDFASEVATCQTCEGAGEICTSPFHTHPNDPDRCDVECYDCEGAGHFACEVCGFDIQVPGYDCLVCNTASEIPAHMLTDDTAAHIGAALAAAFHARSAQA